MPIIDFPNNPSDGQVFDCQNGFLYVWNASKGVWTSLEGGSTPGSPLVRTPSITSPPNNSTGLNPSFNVPAGIPISASSYEALGGAGPQSASNWEVVKWNGLVSGVISGVAVDVGVSNEIELTFADNTSLGSLLPGYTVYECDGTGTLLDAYGVLSSVDAVAKKVRFLPSESFGTWTVGSRIAYTAATPVPPNGNATAPSYTPVSGFPQTLTSSPFNSTNILMGNLDENSTYYARVRYSTSIPTNIDSSFSSWSSFKTAEVFANPYIATPSIVSPPDQSTDLDPYTYTPDGIPLVGHPYNPFNGAGPQSNSTWEVYEWVGMTSPVPPTANPPGPNYSPIVGSPFVVSSGNLLSVNIPPTSVSPSNTYFARVKYGTNSPYAIESAFSTWMTFATASSFVPSVAIGSAYGGGFFGGRINVGGNLYDLVVAPLTSGPLEGQYGGATPTPIQYKTAATADSPALTVQDESYGGGASDLFKNSASHPLFNWLNNATGPNAGAMDLVNGGVGGGTGIGGYNDWYIPAKNELEILYRNLKPTSDSNSITSGSNINAVPTPTSNYTASVPGQTSVALFQSGGGEEFDVPIQSYWTSSQRTDTTSAWGQRFNSGGQSGHSKSNVNYARAIRRIPV